MKLRRWRDAASDSAEARAVFRLARLAETSRGRIHVQLDRTSFFGDTVEVTVFDEEGWSCAERAWSSKYGHERRDESLAEFLSSLVQLPGDEAERLAVEISEEWFRAWRERGGEEAARAASLFAWILLTVLAVLVVLAVLGIVLGILMLA